MCVSMHRSGREGTTGCLAVWVCVGSCVQQGCLLLVKQPVPISPARTQLPGASFINVHSVHTSHTRTQGV